MRATARADAAGWLAVGSIAVGSLAVFSQRVLEVGPQGCTMRAVLGLPCPVCGFSRTGVRFLQGDLIAAFRLDVLAALTLVLLGVVATLHVLRLVGLRLPQMSWLHFGIAAVGLLGVRWVFTATGVVPI